MSFITRAGLYTIRQKQKSFLLFLVLVLVSTLVLTGISIQSAVSATFTEMQNNIAGSISLERNMAEIDHEAIIRASNEGGRRASSLALVEQLNSGDFLTFETLRAVIAVSGVSGYNLTAEFQMMEASLQDFNFLNETQSMVGNIDGEAVPAGQIASLQSATDSQRIAAFLNGNLQLVDGRHLTDADQGKVMISDDLAEYNGIQLGDHLTISGIPMFMGAEDVSKEILELEVVGIFTGTRALEEGEATSGHVLDNQVLDADTLIIDMSTFMEVYARTNYFGTGVAGSLPGLLSIFLEDPNDIENVSNEIANLTEIYGKDFSLSLGTDGLEDVLSSFASLQGLVQMLLIAIALVSLAILAILLTIWMRGRVKEIGIYLANGIKKAEIMKQFMLEAGFIAVIAFALSLPFSQVTAERAGDYIMSQFASAEALRNEQLEGSTSMQELSGFVLSMPETGFMNDANLENTLEMVDIGVSTHDLMWVYVIGLPVLIASVLIASYPVVKLKPKEILTQMS